MTMPDPAAEQRRQEREARRRARETAQRRELGAARQRTVGPVGTRLSGGLSGGSTLLNAASMPAPSLMQ